MRRGCCPQNSAVSRKLGTICFWFRALELQDHGLYLCYSYNKLFKVKKKKRKGVKSTEYQSEWHSCLVCFLLPGALHFKNTCCGFSMIIFPLPVLYLPYCKYPLVESCFSCLSPAFCLSSYSLNFLQASTVYFFSNLYESDGIYFILHQDF